MMLLNLFNCNKRLDGYGNYIVFGTNELTGGRAWKRHSTLHFFVRSILVRLAFGLSQWAVRFSFSGAVLYDLFLFAFCCTVVFPLLLTSHMVIHLCILRIVIPTFFFFLQMSLVSINAHSSLAPHMLHSLSLPFCIVSFIYEPPLVLFDDKTCESNRFWL